VPFVGGEVKNVHMKKTCCSSLCALSERAKAQGKGGEAQRRENNPLSSYSSSSSKSSHSHSL